MKFQLPPLAYDYAALEPHIDARTMEIHYTKHHATYLSNLTKLIEGVKPLEGKTLEEIVGDIRSAPEDIRQGIRNNGGGHLNHSLFWHIMGPRCGGEPTGQLGTAIAAAFGTVAAFREKFAKLALGRFGSGWAWLALDGRGQIELIDTPNQDSPIMQGCKPVLGLDVWEHAYYLKHQNRRAEYIDAWWNVVNWANANELYVHTLQQITRAASIR